MKRCKTCKHWSPPVDDGYSRAVTGTCNRMKEYWDCREWGDDGFDQLKEKYKNEIAFVQDGSDYRAIFLTKEEFGCVLHEDK